MEKVALFYFSGTGNTALVAELFKREFETQSYHVSLFSIDRKLIENFNIVISDYDLIGFGHTIHAFNAPKIVFDCIDRLPDGKGIKTFTFKCPGDPLCQGGSTHLVRNALTRKNYTVIHESLIVGPANVVIRFDDRLIRQLYLTAQKKVNVATQDIINNKIQLQKNSLLLRIFTKLFSDGETRGAGEFGKRIKTTSACTKCLKCAAVCPEQNISLVNGSLQFEKKCVFCMRCIYSCPSQAIVPGFGNFIKVQSWKSFESIGKSESIKTDFITSRTRGFFGHYKKYFGV